MIPGIIAWARRQLNNMSLRVDSTLTVTCDDIITLNAAVVGEYDNITVIWEQISGTPVIWLEEQNQFTVLFQQPAQRDDKVFRFTVNKGRRDEKWAEILVTAIPTDRLITSTNSFNQTGVASKSININNMSALIPAFKPSGSQVKNDIDRAVLLTPGILYNKTLRINQRTAAGDVPVTSYKFTSLLTNLVYVNGLTLDKNYNLELVDDYESGVSSYNNFASSDFAFKPDMALSDEDQLKTTLDLPVNGLASVVEIISREIVNNTEGEETILLTGGLGLKMNGLSSVIEVIDRSVVYNDESQETVATTLPVKYNGLTAIVEVKQFQFSSLG